MKRILAVIFLSVVSVASFATDMILPITGVVDGDTIKGQLSLPCPLCSISIRVRGIDTPESTYLAKCAKEKDLGHKATDYVKQLISSHEIMTVKDVKWDKYGGRIDGYVVVDGIDIGATLIEKGLARPYTGEGPKPNWCN